MTGNKQTIERYLDGFRSGDHEAILSCLTDDVVWDVPGVFHKVGKEEFDSEIENEAFTGHPEITVARVIEENDVVVAQGTVLARPKGGDPITLAWCGVFTMRASLISHLTSFLMEVKD